MRTQSTLNLAASAALLVFGLLFAASAAAAPYTSYNDCVFDSGLLAAGTDPNSQSVHYTGSNVTYFGIGIKAADSSSGSGTAYTPTSGSLVDSATGTATGVTAAFTENTALTTTVQWQPQVASTWHGGYDTATGTDARTTFGGIADMTGVSYYGDAGWWIDLTLTGLDPTKLYTFATTASRAKSNTDGGVGYADRVTIYTLSGADASSNSSTSGVTVISPTSVSFSTGNNHAEGYVARWIDIDPGADGTIVIRAEPDMATGIVGNEHKAYGFDVFLLEEQAAAGVCGDGTLDAPGEECDDGNTDPGDCCSATCQYESTATVCRAAVGVCDAPDNCDGAGTCDPDAKLTSECRAVADLCDVAEVCDGVADDCPTDVFEEATTECRASADDCDVAETCTGSSASCPADAVAPATTECRAPAGVCDAADFCDGVGTACPADLKLTSECRASSDDCDVAEVCDGVADNCPADAVEPATTECRAPVGVCDAADYCDGVGKACTADLKLTSECRAVADVCDVAEVCDGVTNDCPTDGFASAATGCRVSVGICDAPEYCDGVSAACGADLKHTSECRAAVDVCDVAEVCDGVANDCPADAYASATTECRASAGACDVAEMCTGASVSCPADAFEPGTTVCRAAVDVCDAVEVLCPSAPDCPADAKLTSECRPSVHACDAAEFCNGVWDRCPVDQPANGAPCPDGDLCNGNEVCAGFVCVSGYPLDCDDDVSCTADSCDPVLGCVNDPIPGLGCDRADLPSASPTGRLLLSLMLVGAGATFLAWRRRLGA